MPMVFSKKVLEFFEHILNALTVSEFSDPDRKAELNKAREILGRWIKGIYN